MIMTHIQGVTVGASSFFPGTAILHVLSNAIRVLELGKLHRPPGLSILRRANMIRVTDCTVQQIIKDMEGNSQ